MILTCPDCATRYSVADDKVGAGRTVRCANCGARWTASAPDELELSPLAAEPPPPESEPEAPPAEKLTMAFRARAVEKKSIKKAVVHGAVWAALAACLVVVLAASVVFRVQVVRLMPRTASAYAMAGLRVNAVGLSFEDIAARPGLQDGHAALVVSGAIRNIESHQIASPPMRIDVLDKNGKTVASSLSRLEDPVIMAGDARRFTITVLDPPPSADDVQVAFAMGADAAHKAKPVAGGHQSAATGQAPSLRGPLEEEGDMSAPAPTLRELSEADSAPEAAADAASPPPAEPPSPDHG